MREHLSTVAFTATQFQEYIAKAFELRVNVIGSQVFAAEIHSQRSERAKVDFRLAYEDLRYRVHVLPASIEQACRQLVRLFNLQFAALDLLVTPDGQYVFLELNSNGQWGWIENHTSLPLTETLVNLLERGKTEYDRIILTASSPRLARAWLEQLAPGGILVGILQPRFAALGGLLKAQKCGEKLIGTPHTRRRHNLLLPCRFPFPTRTMLRPCTLHQR